MYFCIHDDVPVGVVLSLQILVKYGNGFGNDTVVVIAGLSNTYADYVATFAEYQVRNTQCSC